MKWRMGIGRHVSHRAVVIAVIVRGDQVVDLGEARICTAAIMR